jgi:uncharacterized protein YutD
MINYEVVGHTKDGFEKIKFTNNQFSDIIFSLGRVQFVDGDDGEPRLNFKYDIHMHGSSIDKDEFEKTIAEFIIQKIEEGLKDNSLVYTGGVDEN